MVKITLLKVPDWLKKSQLYKDFMNNISYEIGSLKWLEEMNEEIDVPFFIETLNFGDMNEFENLIMASSYWNYQDSENGNKYPISVYVYCYLYNNDCVNHLKKLCQINMDINDLLDYIHKDKYLHDYWDRISFYIKTNIMEDIKEKIPKKYLDTLSLGYEFQISKELLYFVHKKISVGCISVKNREELKGIVNFLKFFKDDNTPLGNKINSNNDFKFESMMENKIIQMKLYNGNILQYNLECSNFSIFNVFNNVISIVITIRSFKKEYFYILIDVIDSFLSKES